MLYPDGNGGCAAPHYPHSEPVEGGLVNVADTGGRAGRGLSLHPETFSGESERESQAEDDGPPVLASTLTDALAIFREPPPPQLH